MMQRTHATFAMLHTMTTMRAHHTACVQKQGVRVEVIAMVSAKCVYVTAAEKRMTMHKTWCLLRAMSADLQHHVTGSDVTLALNMGARTFLEQSYQQYVRSELQLHRNQVRRKLLDASGLRAQLA